MTGTPDPMAEIRASFFVECEELLEALQDGLQTMDDGDHDDETINVVFRAAHSIKGGAGAFGLDELVSFAHQYETVLDLVRSGSLEISPDLLRVFFSSADILSDLVRASRDDETIDSGRRDTVLAELAVFAGGNAADAAIAVNATTATSSMTPPSSNPAWRAAVRSSSVTKPLVSMSRRAKRIAA